MEKQLEQFNKKYNYSKLLDSLSEEELQTFTQKYQNILDDVLKYTRKDREYTNIFFARELNKFDLSFIKKDYLKSHYILGYMLVKRNDVYWVDCGCGVIGKFRKV